MEHRDLLALFGAGLTGAAVAVAGRRVLVADAGEAGDDLVRDMIEVLAWMCGRLYGRGGARDRALRAVIATGHVGGGGAA